MATYIVPPVYAAFVWWFSTGAVLLLVGRSGCSDLIRVVSAMVLTLAALLGLATSRNDPGVGAAYAAFTSAILLWAAQEIAFLAGWVTGPRAQRCPDGVSGWNRLRPALQAILYHELTLVICGAAIVGLTWNAPNQIALWTFLALWVLRQSAKINLFLGVPVTNDELMPDTVRFLKSYFIRKPVGAFFPVSVTLATAALVIMIQRIVEVAVTPFDVVGLTLVSTLFALGVVEHWFMLLPLPAMTLWGWGIGSPVSPEDKIMEQSPDAKPDSAAPTLVLVSSAPPDPAAVKSKPSCARQRLEDQFRQLFLEQHAKSDLAAELRIGAEPPATVNGRTS